MDLGILGDAREVLAELTRRIKPGVRRDWDGEQATCDAVEKKMVIDPEIRPAEGLIKPGEVIAAVAEACGGKAIVVTDVGQNQLFASRYSRFKQSRSMITSGGLGTMGFGLPAAIGAKVAAPDRPVCLFVGDGGIQMTVQELGTIMQEGTGVKIILLNNNWLGNVRQWQQLFFNDRLSFTRMLNPDYEKLAEAYGITCVSLEDRADMPGAISRMLSDDRPFILNVHVAEADNVFPMIPPGKSVGEIMLNDKDWFVYGK